jgi:hypothetical protein
MNEADYGFTTISSFPKITASASDRQSDADNIIIPDRILDEVHLDNLKKTVYNLSSFYTRHTESEFIDDVAFWLTEKLQNICSREVYVHNFTHTPNEEDDVDSRQDQQHTYHLKNIACKKPGSTNNTIIVSAHYDSRMEDINNRTARAPGADDNASGVSALLEVARILYNVSLNHSIIFVMFSGEEQGKWGSTHYADYIDETDESMITGMLCRIMTNIHELLQASLEV